MVRSIMTEEVIQMAGRRGRKIVSYRFTHTAASKTNRQSPFLECHQLGSHDIHPSV